MDAVQIFEFVINSNPATAVAVLCAVLLSIYKVFKHYESKSREILESHNEQNERKFDEVNRMVSDVKEISDDIAVTVRSLTAQIQNIQNKIERIESADSNSRLDLLYLKQDIESIKRIMESSKVNTRKQNNHR